MHYRQARLADAAAIAGVHIQSWHETYAGLLPPHLIAARTNSETRTAQWDGVLRDDRADGVIVAESGGSIVGFIWVGPPSSANLVSSPGYDAYIHALYIVAAAHRQGAGRELVRLGAEKLLNRGYNSLSVHVLSANPARRFYERLGAHFISEDVLAVGNDTWTQCAYGWNDITPLTLPAT